MQEASRFSKINIFVQYSACMPQVFLIILTNSLIIKSRSSRYSHISMLVFEPQEFPHLLLHNFGSCNLDLCEFCHKTNLFHNFLYFSSCTFLFCFVLFRCLWFLIPISLGPCCPARIASPNTARLFNTPIYSQGAVTKGD